MTFKNGVLVAKNNEFLNLKTEGDLIKVVTNSYNKKSNISNSIILLIEDVWKIMQDLNVFICGYIYKEVNKTMDYLVKKKYL